MPSRCRITPTITPQSTNPVKPSVTTIGDHRCPPSLCSLSFLFSHFSCRVCCPTPLFALASSGKQHPGAIQQRLNSVLLQYHHCPRSSFSPSSTQVVEVTELKIDETQRDHIVELDLVYHSLNSRLKGDEGNVVSISGAAVGWLSELARKRVRGVPSFTKKELDKI
ncbi:hypothetical protein HN51_037779 [Arachis hypogaea]